MNYILKVNLQNLIGNFCNKNADNLLCKASEIIGLLVIIIIIPIFIVGIFYHIKIFFNKTTPIKEKVYLPLLLLLIISIGLIFLEKTTIGGILLVISLIAICKVFDMGENKTPEG